MFRQQLAAVVTAVLWVLVAKKSRYVRQADNPPSRTIEAGYSTEIFSRVWKLLANQYYERHEGY
jgi:hypothetical protein